MRPCYCRAEGYVLLSTTCWQGIIQSAASKLQNNSPPTVTLGFAAASFDSEHQLNNIKQPGYLCKHLSMEPHIHGQWHLEPQCSSG
ncbi:hypothetical protein Q8A67_012331 [Cirrhinus molitorella]|uniref:Uncharacterized protein n=1 Tax=Cirrhinus molitorella TaxID=172907 RepID=A0AA88TXB3_9TELE|nr:hypothetical protein Q8A67_012331 [Cirrhinus molitorella]